MACSLSSNFNAEYVVQAANEGVRQDGRAVDAGSEVEIRLIRGENVAVAEVGLESGSRALCRVTCGLVEPDVARPVEGRVSVAVEASPLDAGRGRAHWVVELEQLIGRIVRDSEVIDREALCVVAGHWVWKIACDVHVLARRGTVGDAAVLAAIAALRHVRRGRVETLPGTQTVATCSIDDGEPQRLPLMHVPLCATTAILGDDPFSIVLDPTTDEVAAARATVSVALTPSKRICAFHKIGGAAVDPDVFLNCIALARYAQTWGDLTPYPRQAARRRSRYSARPRVRVASPCCSIFPPRPLTSRFYRLENADDQWRRDRIARLAEAPPPPPQPMELVGS